MKTVLIVEDEKMIRQGIRVMIQRCGVPVENIVECSNGEMALEMLQEQHVDVMFTDIRMPKMDGIQLVAEVQKMSDKPEIVAISGYDDFSYAVEMLRNGVREYILKPVERQKITSIMQKLEEEIVSRQKIRQAEQVIGKSQLRHLLLDENPKPEEIESLSQKFGETFFPQGYRICVVGGSFALEDTPELIWLQDVLDQNVCILAPEEMEELLSNTLWQEYAGISEISHGIAQVRSAYEEALQCRKQAFYQEKHQIGTINPPHVADAIRQSAYKQLEETAWMQKLHLIGTNKTEELTTLWKNLFTEVRRGHIKPDAFADGMIQFLSDVEKIYHNLVDDDVQEKINRRRKIYQFSGVEAYEEAVMELVLGMHEKIRAQGDDHGVGQKMQQAIAYIQENYNKDLNMAVVSNYISMNYSVFSFEFKNYAGVNFVTYLKELRMKEAKKLLEETDKKIIEISQMVGYENEKHFMKLFKSICGVSPSEYRKNMRHQ